MARIRIRNSIAVAVCLASCVKAQEQVETCYGAGSVVAAVVGTLFAILALLACCWFLYKMYWKSRKGKHLVLMTDAENPNDQYAFDNPCFREETPIKRNIQEEKQTLKLEKNKWLGWSPFSSLGKEQKNEKITAMDDSCVNDSRLKVVTLKSHDFTGLGFNICGNMRDGIFVKDVLHRGPAFESGCINSGDRIDSVCISFRNMVFEDALTILSYASPYDVQVQVENDSYSRPSTLIRSKRESNAVNSAERIRHPKYNRSQSISHLNEIGKNNKRMTHHIGFMVEKNRINQSLSKPREYHGNSNDYPTIKLSSAGNGHKKEHQKLEKTAASKSSPLSKSKISSSHENKETEQSKTSEDPQNKLQKFGVKVLPISGNSKIGIQAATGPKKPKDPPACENEISSMKEKPEKPEKPSKVKSQEGNIPSGMEASKKETGGGIDGTDANIENMKAFLTKGFQNLKEKINQNTLGKKKNKDATNENNTEEDGPKTHDTGGVTISVTNDVGQEGLGDLSEVDCPVPKLRSNIITGVKISEKDPVNLKTYSEVPEEVSKAGDVARSHRKSVGDPSVISARKSLTNFMTDPGESNSLGVAGKDKTPPKKIENGSESDSSSDRDSFRTLDETKKPKRSKGKAPAPPLQSAADIPKDGRLSVSPKQPLAVAYKEMNEIKRESELVKDEKTNIFEPIQPDTRIINLKESSDDQNEQNHVTNYDSDSDVEPRTLSSKEKPNNTKIELNATHVTVHQSPSGDANDEDIEPSRKAASLGDLSKLDSEQPLSIVLERAVSLDLADGTSQCGKKRKAPLPPSEEFPAVFDDMNYRKEPRLENSLGLNTFQRRLKKSSDFGRLEDALYDGPKSLEIEINKHISPLDLTETHNSNIQEFSSWLAECRRPKSNTEEVSEEESKPAKISSTSLVNINSCDYLGNEGENERPPHYEYQGNNVSFSVNGKNFPDFQVNETVSSVSQSYNFPGANSKTVVVISQPNSLEPNILETVPVNYLKDDDASLKTPSKDVINDSGDKFESIMSEDTTCEPFVTANESKIGVSKMNSTEEDETPPKLPTSPMPVMTTSSTLSSPLSSSLTYITEIKVSTSRQDENDDTLMSKGSDSLGTPSGDRMTEERELEPTEIVTSTPIAIEKRAEPAYTFSEKIEKFENKQSKDFVSPIKSNAVTEGITDHKKGSDIARKENHTVFESSKIPIRTMKSETGQRVLATIQSLAAKESSPTKTPEVEYAKRVASLFSGNPAEKNQVNVRKQTEMIENEINNLPNILGFYLKSPGTSPPKLSKDFSPTRKVPPTVPPRKTETTLSTRSEVTVGSPDKNHETSSTPKAENSVSNESHERNIVTFSSFSVKSKNDEPEHSSRVSVKIKELNGEHIDG